MSPETALDLIFSMYLLISVALSVELLVEVDFTEKSPACMLDTTSVVPSFFTLDKIKLEGAFPRPLSL